MINGFQLEKLFFYSSGLDTSPNIFAFKFNFQCLVQEKVYLEPSRTSTMKIFLLKADNYFLKKVSSQMFDSVLTTPLIEIIFKLLGFRNTLIIFHLSLVSAVLHLK